ncbi:hypothetical protein, partial [Streptomyces rhizosphaericus]
VPIGKSVAPEFAYRILSEEEPPEGGWTDEQLSAAADFHWYRITSHFDPSPMMNPELHAPRDQAVMWRLDCPSCSAKMALFGIDAEAVKFRQDAVWIHTYRRVGQQYHGLSESFSEGEYEAFTQVRLTCGTPKCRGFEKYRIETVVNRMHRLRLAYEPGKIVTGALPSS